MKLRGANRGGASLGDIDDALPARAQPAMSYPPRRRCATPGCGMVLSVRNRAGLFGCSCTGCASRLAVIRAELDAAPVYRAKTGRRPNALRDHLAEVDERLGEAA